MHKTPKIKSSNPRYFQKLLKYKNLDSEKIFNIFKVNGFSQYNFLIDINSIFSTAPNYLPIDRTGVINHPIKWSISNSWNPPTVSITLDNAMQQRVNQLSALNKKINVMWSGGIDSTAIVTAFLKFLDDRSQLRIIYSPWSRYEHPEYFSFLKKFSNVELIDQSGTYYLDLPLDGIFISGTGGDEIHASIDESFFSEYGLPGLQQSWKDLFYKKNKNDRFIDFCSWYFSQSGFDVQTVLEARWWFYAACKIDSMLRQSTIPFLISNKTISMSVSDVHGFFNCPEYEQFIYWNIPLIISKDYKSWKQFLKDFCYEFDGLSDWHQNKTKFHSVQIGNYTDKKIILNDKRYILILEDNNLIQTPNLPFLSYEEFNNKYGTSLDYLFNVPDTI